MALEDAPAIPLPPLMGGRLELLKPAYRSATVLKTIPQVVRIFQSFFSSIMPDKPVMSVVPVPVRPATRLIHCHLRSVYLLNLATLCFKLLPLRRLILSPAAMQAAIIAAMCKPDGR